MAYSSEYPYVDPYRYNDDWILNKVKQLTLEWASMQTSFENLTSRFEELEAYVKDYFTLSDFDQKIEDEVKERIDELIADGTLSNLLYIARYAKRFGGKRILVMGDSNSDENATALAPNWVVHLRNTLAAVGATVDNISISGWRWSGNGNLGMVYKYISGVYKNYDYIITMLGTNDYMGGRFIGQFASTDLETVNGAINQFYSYSRTNSPKAEIYNISPIKINLPDVQPASGGFKGLSIYRTAIYMQSMLKGMGFIEAGGWAPGLNPWQTGGQDWIQDGVHMFPSYAPIFCDYVLESMLSYGKASEPLIPFVGKLGMETLNGELRYYFLGATVELRGYYVVSSIGTDETLIATLPEFLRSDQSVYSGDRDVLVTLSGLQLTIQASKSLTNYVVHINLIYRPTSFIYWLDNYVE